MVWFLGLRKKCIAGNSYYVLHWINQVHDHYSRLCQQYAQFPIQCKFMFLSVFVNARMDQYRKKNQEQSKNFSFSEKILKQTVLMRKIVRFLGSNNRTNQKSVLVETVLMEDIVHTYSQICKCLISNKQVFCRPLNSQIAMQIAKWSLVLCEVPFRFCIHVISRIFLLTGFSNQFRNYKA